MDDETTVTPAPDPAQIETPEPKLKPEEQPTQATNAPDAAPQGHQPNHPERIKQKEYDDQEIDGVKLDTDFRVRWLKMNGYPPTRANMIDVDLPSRPELHSQNVLPDDLDGRKLNKNRLEELMEDG